MRNPVVAKAFADIAAAVAVLASVVNGSGSGGLFPEEDDPLWGFSGDCLDILTGAAGADAQLAAVKAQAAVRYAGAAQVMAAPGVSVQAQDMAVTAEVACALTVGERAAGSFLAVSHALATTLPLTLAALQSGTISWQHARVMADEAATLGQAGAAGLEAHFLDPDAPGAAGGCPAGDMPAGRFRHRARTWRERHHTDSLEKRHAKGVLDRRVEYAPDQDGMAWLSAYLPADQAAGIWNRITATARALQGPDQSRTLTQLRADIFATALLSNGNQTNNGNQTDKGNQTGNSSSGSGGNQADGNPADGSQADGNPADGNQADGYPGRGGPGQVPTPQAQVLVTVPVFSLLGLTEEPAILDGYGPIPASMARDLVANGAGSFYRVLIDPRDGAPLEIGRRSYRLTKAMRQWLRLRDGKCPFPGCSNNSLDNEADHLLAWANGGTTGISNLGQPCPKHHRLRHLTGWQPTPATTTDPPGWISPSGRRYTSEHQDWEPPHWPNQPNPQKRTQEKHRPPTGLPDACPDLVHIGRSLGEEGLEQLLHAQA